MKPYRHLSDLRTTLLLRARSPVAGSDVLPKAEACTSALAQARRLLLEEGQRAQVRELLAHARALLDDLDECVLVLPHDEDRAVFVQLALLRVNLDDLDSRSSCVRRPDVEGRAADLGRRGVVEPSSDCDTGVGAFEV